MSLSLGAGGSQNLDSSSPEDGLFSGENRRGSILFKGVPQDTEILYEEMSREKKSLLKRSKLKKKNKDELWG